ncbi:hypothetical protein cypCar_00038796 [Cyprinus carpio]|nr:hypothetical protein cypCar_00038796 [Cyprinus carpio]
MVDMLKTRQCLLGVRAFLGVTSRVWSFFLYILRKHIRTIIQYQTVRYDILPLSPLSRNRLNTVKRKILVLDLDETLIHSHHDGVLRPTVRPGTPPDFILKVVIDKHPVRFFVHKRPHVDFFLEVVSQWYELVVFTASMEIYGSAVADKLDNNKGILKRRYYRQHCTLDSGSYIKDLSVVHADLSSVVILDNSPGAYRSHPEALKSSYTHSMDGLLKIHGRRTVRPEQESPPASTLVIIRPRAFLKSALLLLPYVTSACPFSLDSSPLRSGLT